MRVQFKVEGVLPPKKDGADSMWRKDTEVPRLVALRRLAHAGMAGRPPLVRDVRLGLRVHVGTDGDGGRCDLDNFVAGVCDGLMAAHPNTPWREHSAWGEIANAAVTPDHRVALRDDSGIVEISARKTMGDGDPWYEVTLSDE